MTPDDARLHGGGAATRRAPRRRRAADDRGRAGWAHGGLRGVGSHLRHALGRARRADRRSSTWRSDTCTITRLPSRTAPPARARCRAAAPGQRRRGSCPACARTSPRTCRPPPCRPSSARGAAGGRERGRRVVPVRPRVGEVLVPGLRPPPPTDWPEMPGRHGQVKEPAVTPLPHPLRERTFVPSAFPRQPRAEGEAIHARRGRIDAWRRARVPRLC